jgi:hypothetical protein
MSDYRKMGHAMRRRAGAAMSSVVAAGKKTSVAVPNVIQQHITSGSAKLAVGAVKGTLVPKKNTQAGDPTASGTKQNRKNVFSPGGSERMGAAYKVKSKFSVSDPTAGQTMRNARIVPSTMGTKNGMTDGVNSSME